MKPTRPFRSMVDDHPDDEGARAFCAQYLKGSGPRYVLGRNGFASSIAEAVDVSGFIDDYTDETSFGGKPVVRTNQVPRDSLVVSAVVHGHPLTARKKLTDRGLRQLDYFAFQKYSGLRIADANFREDFTTDFTRNRDRYEWIHGLLKDAESKRVFEQLVNFRLSQNLDYMGGFTDARHRQYFEDFLGLKAAGETFVDAGCYDGDTSLQFMKRCPDYRAIHVFEPEPQNMAMVKQNLAGHPRIRFHDVGLSNEARSLRFDSLGSSSHISESGSTTITVDRLDSVLDEPVTFLKMDIEGEERAAIEGARKSIIEHHPRLAISVYHRFDDFWRVPELVFSCRDDYDVYVRHYTEGVCESVMLFVPAGGRG